jgi:NAD-dependent SIR2 family protein deacetylase
MNVERCEKCSFEQLKDGTVKNRDLKGHYTGRNCSQNKCPGKMRDTIINFGENCNDVVFDLATNSHLCADLCLAMGSSMRLGHVTPMPCGVAANGGNLVLVNL